MATQYPNTRGPTTPFAVQDSPAPLTPHRPPGSSHDTIDRIDAPEVVPQPALTSQEKSPISRTFPQQGQQIITLQPPIGQFLINTLLQISAFTAAIAFGVYAVKSVTVGSDANRYANQAVQETVTANQLALLAVCLATGSGSNQSEQARSLCSRIIINAAPLLSSAASTLLPNLPSSIFTSATTSTSTSASVSETTLISTTSAAPTSTFSPHLSSGLSSSNTGALAGIVVGVIVGVIILLAICIICFRRRPRRRQMDFPPAMASQEPKDDRPELRPEKSSTTSLGERESAGGGSRFRGLFVDSVVRTGVE